MSNKLNGIRHQFYQRMADHYRGKYFDAITEKKYAKANRYSGLLLKYQHRISKLNSIIQSPINIQLCHN
jgi:hypothetical protein